MYATLSHFLKCEFLQIVHTQCILRLANLLNAKNIQGIDLIQTVLLIQHLSTNSIFSYD